MRLDVIFVPSSIVITYSPCAHGSSRFTRSTFTIADRCTRTMLGYGGADVLPGWMGVMLGDRERP